MVGLRPTKTDHWISAAGLQICPWSPRVVAEIARGSKPRLLPSRISSEDGGCEDDWTIRTLFWRLGTIKIAILETIWMAWPKCVWVFVFASWHLSGSAHENQITPQIHASRKTHHFNVNIVAPPAASSCVVYQKLITHWSRCRGEECSGFCHESTESLAIAWGALSWCCGAIEL